MSINLANTQQSVNPFFQKSAQNVSQRLGATGNLKVYTCLKPYQKALGYVRTTLRQAGLDTSRGKLNALLIVLAAYSVGIDIGSERESMIVDFKSYALTLQELERIEVQTGQQLPRLVKMREYQNRVQRYVDPYQVSISTYEVSSSKNLNHNNLNNNSKIRKRNKTKSPKITIATSVPKVSNRELLKTIDIVTLSTSSQMILEGNFALVSKAELENIANYDVNIVINDKIAFKEVFNLEIETVVAFKNDNFDYKQMTEYTSYNRYTFTNNNTNKVISLKIPPKSVKEYTDDDYNLYCYYKLILILAPSYIPYRKTNLPLVSLKSNVYVFKNLNGNDGKEDQILQTKW